MYRCIIFLVRILIRNCSMGPLHGEGSARAIEESDSARAATMTEPVEGRVTGTHRRVSDLLSLGMAILSVGADIRRVSDPTGAGAGGNFRPWVRPAPAPRIGGCGAGFIFHPWVTRGYPSF
jgi:hypothetical protein